MKKSISHLPKSKQEDLRYLVSLINKYLPQTGMIILYGSYARGNYVEYDERVEFGVPTSYMSDYDILVITHGVQNCIVDRLLEQVDDIYYKNPEKQTPVQFINEDILKLNKDLADRRYFYTQIKQEGIMLMDKGIFKLARARKLNYQEIKEQAEGYFAKKIDKAEDFVVSAVVHYKRKKYESSIFNLHQACENYYNAIRLVYSLNNRKQHNLYKLSDVARQFEPEIMQVFPQDTIEEKRIFKLLKDAYVEARYNSDFIVNEADIETLLPKVDLLGDIVRESCLSRIMEYEERSNEEGSKILMNT